MFNKSRTIGHAAFTRSGSAAAVSHVVQPRNRTYEVLKSTPRFEAPVTAQRVIAGPLSSFWLNSEAMSIALLLSFAQMSNMCKKS